MHYPSTRRDRHLSYNTAQEGQEGDEKCGPGMNGVKLIADLRAGPRSLPDDAWSIRARLQPNSPEGVPSVASFCLPNLCQSVKSVAMSLLPILWAHSRYWGPSPASHYGLPDAGFFPCLLRPFSR